MPALAGAELITLLWMFAAFLCSYLIFRWLVETFVGRIPFIGGKLAHAAISIGDAVERRVETWISSSAHTLVSWFSALATRIAQFPDAVEAFANNVEAAFKHLVEVKILDLIHTATQLTRDRLNALRADFNDLTNTVGDIWPNVERRIGAEARALTRAFGQELHNGIDAFDREVVEPAIVGIEHGIRDLNTEVDKVATSAAQATSALAGRIADLAQSLDIPIAVIESLIATFGFAVALDALDALGRCSPKLRMMCSTDPVALADLFAGLILLAAWPGLYALTEDTQRVLGGIAGEVQDVALNGLAA